jgi:hypothetical protein
MTSDSLESVIQPEFSKENKGEREREASGNQSLITPSSEASKLQEAGFPCLLD